MHLNIGGIDQFLRIAAGMFIIGTGFLLHNWWGAVGAVPLLTGLIGYCPAYTLLRLSTRRSLPARGVHA